MKKTNAGYNKLYMSPNQLQQYDRLTQQQAAMMQSAAMGGGGSSSSIFGIDNETDIQKQIKQIARINRDYPMLNNPLGVECLTVAYKTYSEQMMGCWSGVRKYANDTKIAEMALQEMYSLIAIEFADLLKSYKKKE